MTSFTHDSHGSGPGIITPDGCAVDFYGLLPPGRDPEVIHGAIGAGASILELGAGAGRVTHALLRLGHPVVAVDESAEMLERGIRRYYLHRWPSQRSMKRVRQRVKGLTGRNRCHTDIRQVIAELNPVLRGWGGYFRTGNAAGKFTQLDRYVVERLRRLLIKRYGRNLHAGRADGWTREWFEGHGLYRLRGTVRYPGAA